MFSNGTKSVFQYVLVGNSFKVGGLVERGWETKVLIS